MYSTNKYHILLIINIFVFLTPLLSLASADKYWQRPILSQQAAFPLYPENCAACHKLQYDAWKGSLHSKAMSSGLMGQLNPKAEPEFAASCYFCHAPLMEQSEVKIGSRIKGQGPSEYIKNPSFDNKLKLSGVSCSVCHLREGKVYGPTKRGKGQGSGGKGQDGHNGFVKKDFFEKAEFCAACHQMDEGYDLNGKILTNTYREWKESEYGKNNITCQQCHMPDRQHLFRGIHDPDMVKRGVSFEIVEEKIEKGSIKISLSITNSGAGHYFPTYTTPMIIIKGFLINAKGAIIKETVKESYIGRKVSIDLTKEIFDTRIPPKGIFNYEYKSILHKDAERFIIEVKVYPDMFYNGFYKAILKEGTVHNKELIKKALKLTEESAYILYKKEISLNAGKN